MAATQKMIENAKRIRYMRALERFHKSIIGYLSSTQELSKEAYSKKCTNSKKLLDRVEAAILYKGDLQDLETLVKKMIQSMEDEEKTIEEIRDTILYEANQLEKTKNARRYKKEKHSSKNFEEWY
ncbi:MAG: hypothetical protein RBR59_01775 [Sulfurimonadaceae bacterium]|nr:hypothetical protein [Sulfurimonadaceae bacterium]